jgi:cytochrome c-type biogenesis protein
MLPIYITYFAGGGERSMRKTLKGALGFVTGFTVVFVAMGALAGTVGSLLREYQTAVNIVSGLIVIFFGLNFLGVFKFNLFRGGQMSVDTDNMGFFSAVLFGMVFSVGWTPCVGAFLGSALMLASQQGHVAEGMLMLLLYSLGLGIPFILSAVLIDYLKSAFNWIKRNYTIINRISGCLLILIGIMMATGSLGRLLTLLS